MRHDERSPSVMVTLWLAVALSMAATVSLGITRFAYGLLLPAMRDDLGWSYALAGGMNTANAAGYLLGALAAPWMVRSVGPGRLAVCCALLATVFMALSGFFIGAAPLLLLRLLAGVCSALIFIAGGLLAARLGGPQPGRGGLVLGLYYGGTGWGIALSAVLVPAVLAVAAEPHRWAAAWWALACACLAATALLVWPVRRLERPAAPEADAQARLADARRFGWRTFGWALSGYAMFGVGYIGYMTFVVALLQERGATSADVTVFYAALGLAVVAASRVWSGLLDRQKGGGALARLSALLAVATVMPALTAAWPAVLASGILFGGVFLSVVASTTALVRHNLPPSEWARGIAAFTTVFAAGQIVGPSVVGLIADGRGGSSGLAGGLLFSAAALALGAVLSLRQRPVLAI